MGGTHVHPSFREHPLQLLNPLSPARLGACSLRAEIVSSRQPDD
jgi:hypothetical protein